MERVVNIKTVWLLNSHPTYLTILLFEISLLYWLIGHGKDILIAYVLIFCICDL